MSAREGCGTYHMYIYKGRVASLVPRRKSICLLFTCWLGRLQVAREACSSRGIERAYNAYMEGQRIT